MLQGMYELWGEGSTWAELEASIKAKLPAQDPARLAAEASWAVRVDGFGCSIEDPVALLNQLSFVPFEGPVNLKAPDNLFRLIKVGCHFHGPSHLLWCGLPAADPSCNGHV